VSMRQGWRIGVQEMRKSFKKAMSVRYADSYSGYCHFDEYSSFLYTELPNNIEKKMLGRKKYY